MEPPSLIERDLIVKLLEKAQKLKMLNWQKEEIEILRWIRARNGDVEKAFTMLKEHMEFRNKMKLDSFMDWQIDEELIRIVPYELWGLAKDFSGVGLLEFENLDIRQKLKEGFSDEELSQSFLYFFEYIMTGLRGFGKERNTPTKKFLIILNMEKINYLQFSSVQVIQLCAKMIMIYEKNYPESIRDVYVINAPRAFYWIYPILKPMIPLKTAKKITFFSGKDSWQEALYDNIPINVIPIKYGGTGQLCLKDIRKIVKKDQVLLPYHLEYDKILENYENHKITRLITNGEKFNVEINVENNSSCIVFKFESNFETIGFSAYFDKTCVFQAIEANCHKTPFFGYILCNEIGLYTIEFDNSYSKKNNDKNISYFFIQENLPESVNDYIF